MTSPMCQAGRPRPARNAMAGSTAAGLDHGDHADTAVEHRAQLRPRSCRRARRARPEAAASASVEGRLAAAASSGQGARHVAGQSAAGDVGEAAHGLPDLAQRLPQCEEHRRHRCASASAARRQGPHRSPANGAARSRPCSATILRTSEKPLLCRPLAAMPISASPGRPCGRPIRSARARRCRRRSRPGRRRPPP